MVALTKALRGIGLPERCFAWVAAALACVALVFWSTSASMVSVWNSSGTYSHGFFIVPAFLWLVWGRRRTLAGIPIRPSWWSVPVVGVLGLVWLLGHWMALALPSQFAMVAMVPAVIAGTLGTAWVRALLFPLVYLFFAVPFGESLVPVLMNWTADFTVAALKLSGVPVYRDGLHFEIPSGRWSVVDSCSGIRYLFACLALSSLYAWTIYRATLRRLLFVGLAIAIAIVANWIRAYAIVMLGHFSDNRIATGADHLVYGGIFFAVIMALVFALGALWREDAPAAADAGGTPVPDSQEPRAAANTAWAPQGTATATIAMLLVWPAVSILSVDAADTSALTTVAVTPRAGWQPVDVPLASWRPVLRNPVAVWSQTFAKDDQAVGLHIGMFGRSTIESKLTTAMNRLVEPDGLNKHWKLSQQGKAEVRWGDKLLTVRTGTLVSGQARLVAWHWYWVDQSVTADPIRASVLQLLARLQGRSDLSAWIALYVRDTGEPGAASRQLQEFVGDMSMSIDAAISRPTAQGMTAGLTR